MLRSKWLITGRKDGEILVWVPDTWTAKRLSPGLPTRCHDKEVTTLTILDELVISGSADATVKVGAAARVTGPWHDCLLDLTPPHRQVWEPASGSTKGVPSFTLLRVLNPHASVSTLAVVSFRLTHVLVTSDCRGKTKVGVG